jgi:fatty-acyl-CoA synthase
VGDAMARPLVEELERGNYDTSGFMAFGSGGAMLSEGMKTRILTQMPNILVSDVAGASETGAQMGTNSTAGSVSTGRFVPGPGATVVSEDLTHELKPGD